MYPKIKKLLVPSLELGFLLKRTCNFVMLGSNDSVVIEACVIILL